MREQIFPINCESEHDHTVLTDRFLQYNNTDIFLCSTNASSLVNKLEELALASTTKDSQS